MRRKQYVIEKTKYNERKRIMTCKINKTEELYQFRHIKMNENK